MQRLKNRIKFILQSGGLEPHSVVVHIFLRLLGLNYLFTFLNLTTQATGLWGSNGVLSIQKVLQQGWATDGAVALFKMPTLFWICSSDWMISSLIWLCVLLSLFLIFGVFSKIVLFILWICFLSLSTVTNSFLIHMWDRLLLEIGFIVPFLLTQWKSVGFMAMIALRLLWMRHMFVNGVEKFYGFPDPKWEDLSFISSYWSLQPYPNKLAWWFSQWPPALQKVFSYWTFAAEVVFPWLCWGPRRIRRLSFVAIGSVQLAIFCTGNYGVFNFLTLTLSLLILDDGAIGRILKKFRGAVSTGTWAFRVKWFLSKPFRIFAGSLWLDRMTVHLKWPLLIVLMLQIYCQGLYLTNGFYKQANNFDNRWIFNQPYGIEHGNVTERLGSTTHTLMQTYSRFFAANIYGIYGSAPSRRHLLIIEGSPDGFKFYPYKFKKMPMPEEDLPLFAPFFRPHLDSDIWLDSLGLQFPLVIANHQYFTPAQNWPLGEFYRGLFANSDAVKNLLAEPPLFPDAPEQIRIVFLSCRFSTLPEFEHTLSRWMCEETNEGLHFDKNWIEKITSKN